MRSRIMTLSLGLLMLGAMGVAEAEEIQDYILVRMSDGSSVLEKAWVVSPRIIVTTPFEMEAYLADGNGLLTSSKANVNFLARNRLAWMKVYTSDVDLPVSKDIPEEVLEVMTGLHQAIERAGGLENFRKNVQPRQKRYREPIISVDSGMIKYS
ncbi:MAG: hypothetical protein OEZ32_13275 [Nitrospinota bacterium]|nr:hypothetical protein [Nitrospinota bacterium]